MRRKVLRTIWLRSTGARLRAISSKRGIMVRRHRAAKVLCARYRQSTQSFLRDATIRMAIRTKKQLRRSQLHQVRSFPPAKRGQSYFRVTEKFLYKSKKPRSGLFTFI